MSSGLAPRPGAAPTGRMLRAQTALETRLLLRGGEQLLLTVVIPLVLLALLVAVPVVDVGDGPRADFVVPGILALAVMSTAFTGQAIATAYERRYGALKLLGASPLPRWALLVAKTLTVLLVELLQVVLVSALGAALGWRPDPTVPLAAAVVLLVLLGTAAFSGLALLMAGTLRAEATLAAANLVYLLLLLAGGIVVPLSRFPGSVRPVLELTPTAALSDGLRRVLQDGDAPGWRPVLVLLLWAAVSLAAAARTFRWE